MRRSETNRNATFMRQRRILSCARSANVARKANRRGNHYPDWPSGRQGLRLVSLPIAATSPRQPPATRQANDDAVVLCAAPTLVRPEANLVGNPATFTWPASVGQRYRVQFKSGLSDPRWQMPGSDLTAASTTVSIRDAGLGVAAQRFYAYGG